MNWLEKLKAAFATKNDAEIKKVLESAPSAVLTADCAARTGDNEGAGGSVQQHFHMATGATPPSTDRKYTDDKLDNEFKAIREAHDGFKAQYATDHKSVMDGLEEIKKKMTPSTDAEVEKEVEGELKEEAPAGTGDAAAKATDSKYMVESFQSAVAKAEIIAPGIAIPTFDSAAKPGKTLLAVCALRIKALTLGNNDPTTNAIIEKVNGGKAITADSLSKMSVAAVRVLFNGVAAMKAAVNSTDTSRRDVSRGTNGGGGGTEVKRISSIADVNKKNKEFWANQ